MPEGPRDELGRRAASHRALLHVLADHAVDYLLVGGLAVIAHGYGRTTLDLDILPAPDSANMARLAEALKDLDTFVVGAKEERRQLDLSHPESLAVGNHFLETKHGALDLVNGPRPDIKRYRRFADAAIETTVSGHLVKVVSKDDLIAMKREAGREKDLADIAALTEAERNP